MSNIISIPLNKLIRSARNVRKSGGESIDGLGGTLEIHQTGSSVGIYFERGEGASGPCVSVLA
jgi:hypothetical protein